MSGQGDKCRLLISPHEATVAVDVGAEDSGELAFHTHLSADHPSGCDDCQISIRVEARSPWPFPALGGTEGLALSLRVRRMRCAKCGTESTTSRKFCAECGSPLSSRCPKCGAENGPSSAFCEDCGTALTANTASASPSSPQAANISMA